MISRDDGIMGLCYIESPRCKNIISFSITWPTVNLKIKSKFRTNLSAKKSIILKYLHFNTSNRSWLSNISWRWLAIDGNRGIPFVRPGIRVSGSKNQTTNKNNLQEM